MDARAEAEAIDALKFPRGDASRFFRRVVDFHEIRLDNFSHGH